MTANFRHHTTRRLLIHLLASCVCALLGVYVQAPYLKASDLNTSGLPAIRETPGPALAVQGTNRAPPASEVRTGAPADAAGAKASGAVKGRQTVPSALSLEKLVRENGAGATLRPDISAHLNVLILGDSLSLCGFGEHLDKRFRADPQVKATFTYMACGTIPVSWLKRKPFTDVKTYCGFWSIESIPGTTKPKVFQDTYGLTQGYRPQSHAVPKLEDLLPIVQPQIVVMQTGTNLFGLFRDRKTVQPDRQGPAVKSLVRPFLSEALKPSSPVQRLYWVASPTSGRVSKEIQDFVVEQIRSITPGTMTVIDSRRFVSYPYRHMAPDREHFFGEQMDQWAEKVFAAIASDLSSRPLASQMPVERAPAPAPPPPASTPPPTPAPIPPGQPGEKVPETGLSVRAVLAFKSKPLRIDQLLPYQESLVAYVYDVGEVLSGEYKQKQIAKQRAEVENINACRTQFLVKTAQKRAADVFGNRRSGHNFLRVDGGFWRNRHQQ